MSAVAAALAIRWHAATSGVAAELWDTVFPLPWEGRFWFDAIQAGTAPGQFTCLYGELLRGADPIGIVPAFVFDVPLRLVIPPALARIVLPFARGPLRGLRSQRTFFIGNIAGEEGHVGLLPGESLQALAAFIHAEARAKARSLRAPMLVWKDFPAEDRTALDGLVEARTAFRIPSFPGTRIALLPGGYDAFLARQRSDRRHRIRSKLRKGAAFVALHAEVVSQPGHADLATLFALFEQTRARATTEFETLTPAFFREIAASPLARFLVLREDGGRIVAFMLLLDLGTRIVNQFIGLDRALLEPGRLYFRLHAAACDWAAATGAPALFSGQTGYMAKLDMGHELVPLWNYCEHEGALPGAVFRRVAAGIRWDTLDPQLAEYFRAHPEARARLDCA